MGGAVGALLIGCAPGILAGQGADAYAAPEGYYEAAEGMLGDELRLELHGIIDDHRVYDYDAMRTAPRTLDVDPDNENNILLIYSGESVPGHLFNSVWNREHVWPQSFGADSDTTPGSDFHHLFPCDAGVNSARSNLVFDYTNPTDVNFHPDAPESTYDDNSWEPRDEDKGRIARAMLYMDLRYESGDGDDFQLAETASQSQTTFAKLYVLLEWNRLFPPDEREQRRNHLIHTGFSFSRFEYIQGNRNPFVDFPELAEVLHDAEDRIAWGEWRWENFSVPELNSGEITTDLSDPDGDDLVNLLEYSANLDPQATSDAELLGVFPFPGFGIQVRYTRQKEAHRSGVFYQLEASTTPLREETWIPLGEDDFNSVSITGNSDLETVTSTFPPSEETHWFRLRVSRETSKDEFVTSVYNPVLAANPDTADSLFVYAEQVGDTPYRDSAWMGFVADATFPWVYHSEHKWAFFTSSRDDAVWFFDPSLGWIFTNSSLYPQLYSVTRAQWLLFLKGTVAPQRWFYSEATGYLQEQDF